MPSPDEPAIVARMAIEFLEPVEITRCGRCGRDTLEVATAVLTLDDVPQGGPQVYAHCTVCDVDDITVEGRAGP